MNNNKNSAKDQEKISWSHISLILKKFIQKIRLPKLIGKILTDPRSGWRKYSLVTILMCALSVVLFRCGSKNAFDVETHNQLSSNYMASMIDSKSSDIPVIKTIDDVLSRLDESEIDELGFCLFEGLVRSKFFLNHPQLTPGGDILLAIDAETVRTYSCESAHNPSSCPFCLKRCHGTKTVYHHINVVVSVVGPGKLSLPIYSYPIHAKNVKEDISEEKFKQECELSAFKKVIGILRERFPRQKFCLLLDALYANGPTIRTIEEKRMNYMIVYKAGCARSLAEDCEGLSKTAFHKIEEKLSRNKDGVLKECEWFNDLDYQGLKLNMLKYEEMCTVKSGDPKKSSWMWLVSDRLTKSNALKVSDIARLRWLEEDLFNTLEERGFNIHHDYSRDSKSQIIWYKLIIIAYFITELFVKSDFINEKRSRTSVRGFMETIFKTLLIVDCGLQKDSLMERRIQFRYTFPPTGPP